MQQQPITDDIYIMYRKYNKLSVLTAIFSGEPWLAGFIGANDNGRGGDNWSYKTCKAPVKITPLTNQNPVFYRPDALPVAQPTVSKHRREKKINKHNILNTKQCYYFGKALL